MPTLCVLNQFTTLLSVPCEHVLHLHMSGILVYLVLSQLLNV